MLVELFRGIIGDQGISGLVICQGRGEKRCGCTEVPSRWHKRECNSTEVHERKAGRYDGSLGCYEQGEVVMGKWGYACLTTLVFPCDNNEAGRELIRRQVGKRAQHCLPAWIGAITLLVGKAHAALFRSRIPSLDSGRKEENERKSRMLPVRVMDRYLIPSIQSFWPEDEKGGATQNQVVREPFGELLWA